MNPDIFRQYDIRGVADKDLTDSLVQDLGKAIVTFALRRFSERLRVVGVGYDMRLSSPRLRDAITRGFNSVGCKVVDLGMIPTGTAYFSTYHLDIQAAVQITGSHNPAEYNGFKTMIGNRTLHGEAIQDIRQLIEKQDFVDEEAPEGPNETYPSLIDDYMQWIKKDVKIGERRLKVVVDCGNGAGGLCAQKLVESTLGQSFVGLYTTPDGSFPNHHPDPTVPANLQDLIAAVKKEKADVGVAYDGDADRIGIVDENGKILFGDTLLLLLSRAVLKENPGATIIGEVKCSQKLFDDIKQHGGVPIMAQVGHSLIKAKLKETNAKLAGEVSGHIFYNDHFFGFDDGIYATARLLEILTNTDKTVSELLADVPETFATPEIRQDCQEDIKFDVPGIVAKHYQEKGFETITIDGVRVNFGDGAWALCRASNTQPALSLRVEAKTETRRDELFRDLEAQVKAATDILLKK